MSRKHAGRPRLWFSQPLLGRGDVSPLVAWSVAVVAITIVPFFAGPWLLSTVRDALVMGILALSYDLLWGRAGMLTLGHTTFLGLGAYGFAIATVQFGQASATGLASGAIEPQRGETGEHPLARYLSPAAEPVPEFPQENIQ